MCSIRYLPLAKADLEEITRYIVNELKNPKAARDLRNEMDKSIRRLRDFPFSCQRYQSPKPLSQEYRLLLVKNYYVVYTVIDKTVEIRRVVYARRNLSNILR